MNSYWLLLATLSNVPLYKRDHWDLEAEEAGSTSKSAEDSKLQEITSDMNSSKSGITPTSINRTIVPHARWVPYERNPNSHVFIASAVLTNATLEKYIGNSRKYSVMM